MALRNRQVVMLLPMRVWDLPIRLFHWLLALLVVAAFVTMKAGFPALHPYVGLAILTLLLFRLAWGIVGSDTARFARFLASPAAALRHLRLIGVREADTQLGHNPAGGWAVLAMLLVLAVQGATGLFAHTGHGTEGPLAKYLDPATVDAVSAIHAGISKLVFGLVVLHVLAVAVYLTVKGQNLIRPMLTGKKRLPAATRAPRMASSLLALLLLIVAAAVAATVATQF